MTHSDRGVSRRNFVKAAVAIGGAAALSACLGRESPDLPQGNPARRPTSQHAWNDALATDGHGNHRPPRHQLLLLLDYTRADSPTKEDRETVETAFESLERAYPYDHEGLLFTVGYSPEYFDRFDVALPDAVDLPDPEPLAPFEDPVPDTPDVLVHLASDYGSVLLTAEEALLGDLSTANGVEVTADLRDSLELSDRRTGFTGDGLPASNQDVSGIPDTEPVPEDSPLFMGFKSGFSKNQASEGRVTIDEGPFSGGSTQHVSKIRLHLDQWYEQDSRYHRVATMFCPAHAEEGLVDGVGENLGDSSQLGDCPAHTVSNADEYGVVGHSQKSARVRDENDEPLILRRDVDSTDDDRATLHFVALQRSIGDFVETREAMNGTDVADAGAIGTRTNNGILQYMTVDRRGNYLLPPRELRALPHPQPTEVNAA